MEFRQIKRNGSKKAFLADGLVFQKDGQIVVSTDGKEWDIEVDVPVGKLTPEWKGTLDRMAQDAVEERKAYGYSTREVLVEYADCFNGRKVNVAASMVNGRIQMVTYYIFGIESEADAKRYAELFYTKNF